jgi:glycosyltransferase involved in cell wall biosynthesis
VVDNQSTDETVAIAKQYGAKVFSRPNQSMLNINKNYGFEQANSEWILNLDADERVTPELKDEIQRIIMQAEFVGYQIPRKNIILNRWIQHGLWWPDYQLRLFKRGQGRFACNHVHEYLEVDGKTAQCKQAMIHENYQSVSQYIRKLNDIYTENEAEQLIEQGYQFSWPDLLLKPVNDFVGIYVARQGYKDGLHGLVLSLLQSFYTFITILKVWERQGLEARQLRFQTVTKELHKSFRIWRYWELTGRIEQESHWLKRIYLRLRRKCI